MNFPKRISDEECKRIITLKIDSFSQRIVHIQSPTHIMCGLQWKIDFRFYDEDSPSVYLQCKAQSKKTTSWCCYAETELMLVSQKEGVKNLTRKTSRFFHEKITGWGYHKFGTLYQFIDPKEGYIKNGTIILQAHVHATTPQGAVLNIPASEDPGDLSSQPLTVTVTNRAGLQNTFKVSSELNELRKEKILCDVNIVVNDRVFPCHRNVLASACDYFKAMFTHNFSECRKKNVTLRDIGPNTFEQVLDFIYTGTICVDHENVYPLLIGSDFLGLSFIGGLCILYLENHIPNNNIAKICSFAVQKDDDCLIESILQPHVKKNFVSLSHELLSLPSNVLMEILTPDCVQSNTVAVLNFLLEWVKVSEDTQFIIELMNLVGGTLPMDLTRLSQLMSSMMEIRDKVCNTVEPAAGKRKRKRTC